MTSVSVRPELLRWAIEKVTYMLMTAAHHHQNYLPSSVARLENPQTDIPRIAKDKRLMAEIEAAVQQIPTEHRLVHGDARKLSFIEDESVHLVVTGLAQVAGIWA